MRRAAIAATCLVLVAGGFAAGRFFPGGGAAVARKATRYQCPMHPAVTSDGPGTAPCCGMAFEPVREGGTASASGSSRSAGAVAIDSGLRQLQGVKVATVEKSAESQSLRLFGRVVPDETRVYTLNAALEGSIRELSGVTTGTVVQKDEWLGAFFAPELRTPMQGYMTAIEAAAMDEKAREMAGLQAGKGSTPSKNLDYAGERLRSMGIPQKQIDRIRATRELPTTIDILSPTNGVVLMRTISLGQRFDKGAEWFRIANLDRVWVLADVTEADLPLVRPGTRAKVVVPGRPGEFTATVSRVPPQFDPSSRTLKVRLELDNPGGALRPDMLVDVGISASRPAAITVPVDAIVDAGLRKTVFVETSPGTFEPRLVETGWRAGDRVEIRSGLTAGERIVTSGTFLVDSESQMRAAAAGVRGTPALDPICGMEVDEARARAEGKTATYQGKTYHFCSDSCRAQFTQSPEKYAGHDHSAHGGGSATQGARAEGRP